MITFRRVAQLNREAQAKTTRFRTKEERPQLIFPELDPRLEARILALAEALQLPTDALLSEILACALGDAHDGFLATYPEREDRLKADSSLKSRVDEILDQNKEQAL